MTVMLSVRHETPRPDHRDRATPRERTPVSRGALLLASLLPLSLALAWGARRSPEVVESIYARVIYPRVGSLLSRLSDMVPFSVAEALVAIAAIAVAARVVKVIVRLRRGRRRIVGVLRDGFVAAMGYAGLLHLLFLVVWGFNYSRYPLATIRGLDVSSPSTGELVAVCEELITAANAFREEVEEDETTRARLSAPQRETLQRADLGYVPLAYFEGGSQPAFRARFGAPKQPLCSPLLAYLGIAGIYVPFTGEAHVNATLPDAVLPFTACHELAHQRGFAREDEASFLAYLACRLHPDIEYRYSGAFIASMHALGALGDSPERDALIALRSDAVRRDIEAYREWLERYESPLEHVAAAVNDTYLRAQGDSRGVRSYGRMVDLLIAEWRQRQAEAAPESETESETESESES